MLHENQLGPVQLADFEHDYLAGYGYGLGFRNEYTMNYFDWKLAFAIRYKL
jgi:hypothetical protein